MDFSKIITLLFAEQNKTHDTNKQSKHNSRNKHETYQRNTFNRGNDMDYIDLELGQTNTSENCHINIYHKDDHSYKSTYGYFVTPYNFTYTNK